jgi:hypothetical protein
MRNDRGASVVGIVIAVLIVVSIAAGVGYYVWYLQGASAASSEGAEKCKKAAEGVLSVGRYDSPALIRIDNKPNPKVDNTDVPPVDGPVLICEGVGFFNDGYKAPIEYGMVNEDSEVGFVYEPTGDLERVE